MKRLLLIEPDRPLARIYQSLFESDGYTVDVAGHAQDAVHAADDNRPDIVVLELQLAGHNGIEFIYEFKSYTEWQGIPIIINSVIPQAAFGMNFQTQRLCDIVRYLYKPSTSLKRLRRVLLETEVATLGQTF